MERVLIEYRVEDGIGIVEIANPPANTYSFEMMRQLDDVIVRARFDESVHVLVVRGQGEKFFSAGADISMLDAATPEFKYYFCLHANETLNRLERTPKLVIAALNGHTVGGGLEIALACDIRLARKDGGRVGLPEISLGVLPGTGGTQRLARCVGKSRALELIASGRTFSFAEAGEMGLVHEVFDGEDFFGKVLEYARRFTPPAKASRAVGRAKLAVQTGSELPLWEALALEQELQAALFVSDDARAGVQAYLGKKAAQFRGR